MDLFSHKGTDLLVRAFLSLKTEEECKAFLEDLLTTREVLDLSQRLLVARLLDRQLVYGAGGYTTILPRIAEASGSEAKEPAT